MNDPSAAETHLELTDGWYSIRTVIDAPLADLIAEGKIQIGMALQNDEKYIQTC